MAQLRSGVWLGPRGVRLEVSEVSEGRWCLAVFPGRRTAGGTSVVLDATEAAERLHQMEATGYVYQPGRQPGPEPGWTWDRYNTAWVVILAVLVLVVVIAAGR